MPCERVRFGNGYAIVCTRRKGKRAQVLCESCGDPAERLCDWKLSAERTCDAGVCLRCTTNPAPEKDLCPHHAEAWRWHPANRGTG